jgi:hypothetical protein
MRCFLFSRIRSSDGSGSSSAWFSLSLAHFCSVVHDPAIEHSDTFAISEAMLLHKPGTKVKTSPQDAIQSKFT